jgi:4-diphosphocytidyl-2C-methyl-D-erythritol kinase
LRADGFHEVFSLMVPVSLGDTVKIEPTFGGGLVVECDVAPGEANLAARLVRELESRLQRTFDVHVTIRKRVPAAAGLGGGSSDAATTLIGLGASSASTWSRGCAVVAAAVAPTCPSSSEGRSSSWAGGECSGRRRPTRSTS